MISVVIAAWGPYASAPLAEAVRSVRAQDEPIEVIVVDNGSDPPIAPIDGARIVRLPERRTLGSARNAGLDAVTTPYTVFWDADDLMLPGALRAMRTALEAARADAVACACAILDGETGRRLHWPRRRTAALARRPRLFAWLTAVWSQYPLNTALVRTDAIRACGGFAPADRGSEDWAPAVSLAFRGRILLLDHPGLWYRMSPASLSGGSRRLTDVWRSAAVVRERLRTDRGVPSWARASWPLVAALQVAVMLVVRPPARLLRRMRGSGPMDPAVAFAGAPRGLEPRVSELLVAPE